MIINIIIALISFIIELMICLKARRFTVKLMIPIAGTLILFVSTMYIAIGAILGLYSYIVYTSAYKMIKVDKIITEDSLLLEERILKDEGKLPRVTYEYSRLFKPISLSVLLYAIQFIIFPFVFKEYYPVTLKAALIFVISSSIISLIHNITDNKYGLSSSVIFVTVYIILVVIYSNNGCYGIGLDIQSILCGQVTYDKITALKEIPLVTLLMYGLDVTIYLIIDGLGDISKTQVKHTKLRSGQDEKIK